MGKRERNKGIRFERLGAEQLTLLTGINCVRGAQRKGGPDSPDITSPPGTHCEVKSSKRFGIRKAWLEQMRREAPKGAVPFLLFKENRQPWLFVCRLDDFLALARLLVGRRPSPALLTPEALELLT